VNEWALIASADELGLRFDRTALDDETPPSERPAALAWLRARAAAEHGVVPEEIVVDERPDVPIALVTGSNGKTTTTRLLAAMLRAEGHTVGYCCTDGVFVGDECVVKGDFSGPEGARLVLRDVRVTAAVLETARGGLLRRGLIVPRANAAVITNVAADHFGDYGVDTLVDLARVKGIVGRALGPTGVLVLNGDDPSLRAHPPTSAGSTKWFTTESPDDLIPPVAEMPVALGGAARHNVANALAAAHVARAMGVARETILATLRTFGADNSDNAGRLERFDVGGVRVWVDYAHNPHGLAALLDAARAHLKGGRLGLLLGQAGDRDDVAIRDLARTAWAARPARIVLKDLEGYLRGRTLGEVPALLREELIAAGARADQLAVSVDDVEGVRALLTWAAAGDLLVLPVHALDARERAVQLIQNWA
jgi:UDP-N-acetylmuramyl tripeptide synthase